MTDKAYIVANEQQEREVLEKLEQEGLIWSTGRKPTERMPSSISFSEFPYVLFSRNRLSWGLIGNLSDEEIVFDGRKEEQMSEKYVVSQDFMDELEKWKDYCFEEYGVAINSGSIEDLPDIVNAWWRDDIPDGERNNRLIAILRWVNGEDVFEIEKPKRWVVRSKETDSKGSHLYVFVSKDDALCYSCLGLVNATHFATKEEAQSWANSHQEVIEVEE